MNHPNIATLHDLEESDGTQFLVMELDELLDDLDSPLYDTASRPRLVANTPSRHALTLDARTSTLGV